jgi:hypothetical protein
MEIVDLRQIGGVDPVQNLDGGGDSMNINEFSGIPATSANPSPLSISSTPSLNRKLGI